MLLIDREVLTKKLLPVSGRSFFFLPLPAKGRR
jgi:hypothetical protein